MQNKIVVIIGASSGIGEATAIRLAGDGHQVVIAARRADRLTQIAERINADGGRATALPVDVTDQAAVAALADSVVAQFGGLDVVVACAGLMPLSPLNALKLEEWKRMIDVNIRGLLFSIAAVLPQFQRQGGGHFVTIGSTAAGEVIPASAVYSATKSAAGVITEGLRLESNPSIRVTTISPGVTETELPDSITDPATQELSRAVIKKLAISPDAIAAAISYAVSQAIRRGRQRDCHTSCKPALRMVGAVGLDRCLHSLETQDPRGIVKISRNANVTLVVSAGSLV